MIVTKNNMFEFMQKHVIARTSAYARQQKDGRYHKVDRELTSAAIIRHLQHKITLGFYNTGEDGRVKFCMWDIDNHEGKEIIPPEIVKNKARKIVTTLKSFDIHYVLAESSPGCYHVFVFFAPTVLTAEAHDFGRWVAKNADVESECFPKQRNVPEGEYGNLIRGPASLHQKKRTIYRFINDRFEYVAEFEVKTIDITGFKAVSAYNPHPPVQKETIEAHVAHTKISRGGVPPCIQSALQQEMTGGGGHYARIAAVCAYRDVGLNFAQLCKLFTGQADYDSIETAKQVNSVLKKDGGYSYSCYSLREKCARFTNCEKCAWGKRFITSPAKDKLRKSAWR